MLQMTARRLADRDRFAPPMVIANAAQADPVEEQLRQAGLSAGLTIIEPEGRNTAAAIALAALAAAPDDLLLIAPSDHLIEDADAFRAAVAAAEPVAREGWLATFGIRPDRPETGYGYIRRGPELAPGVCRAEGFVEKPDAATAAAYLEEGCYDWNGGIFLFRADACLAALEAHAPDILEGVRAAVDAGRKVPGRLLPDPGAFTKVRAQSIDHAVMEHADRIAVAPVEMRWSDIGSWDALWDIGERDPDGNVSIGRTASVSSANCLLVSEGPKVVAVGVEDLIVVATGEVVMIVPRGKSQLVREAAAKES